MISEELAAFVTTTRKADLPSDVLTMARQSLLDWSGSAIRGSVEPPARMFIDLAREEGGQPRATALPGGWKTSVTWAARINAAASHTMEMDDLHPASVLHPGAPVIPAALAMGEALDSSGVELIEAIVVGYEIAIRAGEAAGRTHYDYWHTTATCGTFGAAMAAAKLLKLDSEQIIHALGAAGTQSAGLWVFLEDGAMSKQLHPAHAAAAGVVAAELARRGFTAARRIFEGSKGFLDAMSADPQPELLTRGLGSEFRLTDNSFKKHAACRHTHSAIDAVIEVRGDGVEPEEIECVTVAVYPAACDLLEGVRPTTAYTAKFSLPFTVATALSRGHATLADFEDVNATDIVALIPNIEVVRDESLGEHYPEKWPARVTLRRRDGTERSALVEYPRGDSRNPLSQDELEQKFRTLTRDLLSPDQQDHVVRASSGIEDYPVRAFWPFR